VRARLHRRNSEARVICDVLENNWMQLEGSVFDTKMKMSGRAEVKIAGLKADLKPKRND